jgi:hypothetical protein
VTSEREGIGKKGRERESSLCVYRRITPVERGASVSSQTPLLVEEESHKSFIKN